MSVMDHAWSAAAVFHTVGSETAKLLWSYLVVLERGTRRSPCSAERKWVWLTDTDTGHLSEVVICDAPPLPWCKQHPVQTGHPAWWTRCTLAGLLHTSLFYHYLSLCVHCHHMQLYQKMTFTQCHTVCNSAIPMSIPISFRAFPVAGCRLWNSLPSDVTSTPTLTVFRNRLKTHLFSRSFPA